MKAMILAAGLGTRLRPWTLEHPKALIPVGGVPMLERVILNLKQQGFDDVLVNIHHFGEQIIDFLSQRDFGVRIRISDERGELLDTGGGILKASRMLCEDNRPFLVHNVDVLSDANLKDLMNIHHSDADATLLVSDRASSRKLVFDRDMNMVAWHDLKKDIYRPDTFKSIERECEDYAFSGIHVLSPTVFEKMSRLGFEGGFSIMDFYIRMTEEHGVKGYHDKKLQLLDIGKPETLSRADEFVINL